METIKINSKLSSEERETVLVYDSMDKVWYMDSTVMKHTKKAKKQDWEQTVEYVYEDGTVCGGKFKAPATAITIRNPNKKRVMSDKQMGNLHGHDDDEDDEEED